jgi:hypothetical protein
MRFLNPYLLSLVFGSLFLVRADAASNESAQWIRRPSDVYPTPRYEPFRLETIASDKGRLIGTVGFGERLETRPAAVEGELTPDDLFWLNVTAQVANDTEAEWKTIGEAENRKEGTAISVPTDNPKRLLYVDLDEFRPYLGKLSFGRIVLKNGQAAVFRMADLLTPESKTESNGSKSNDWEKSLVNGYNLGPLTKAPFAVVGVKGAGNHVEAVCSYGYVEGHSTEIEGIRTADGGFWPYVSAEVSNELEGTWKAIGQISHNGEPATFTVRPAGAVPNPLDSTLIFVDMDVFRPMIGKFKYGRVVLKSGVAAAFELKELLPETNDVFRQPRADSK